MVYSNSTFSGCVNYYVRTLASPYVTDIIPKRTSLSIFIIFSRVIKYKYCLDRLTFAVMYVINSLGLLCCLTHTRSGGRRGTRRPAKINNRNCCVSSRQAICLARYKVPFQEGLCLSRVLSRRCGDDDHVQCAITKRGNSIPLTKHTQAHPSSSSPTLATTATKEPEELVLKP
jgi:hypothetical protein